MATPCLQNIPQQYLELHFASGEEPSTAPAPTQGTAALSPPPEAEIMVLVPLVICEVVLMPRSPPGLVSC